MNEQTTNKPPWERLPDEPNRWYDRFDLYRSLGPTRSILAAFRTYYIQKKQNPSDHSRSEWYGIAKTWKWKERAEAYDEQQRKYFHEHEAELQKESRRRRIEALELFLDKCIEALRALPAEKASYASLAQSMKTIARELRAEHGEIDRRTKVELDIMLKELPADLRQALLTALQADDKT